jgi:hypothetical protein
MDMDDQAFAEIWAEIADGGVAIPENGESPQGSELDLGLQDATETPETVDLQSETGEPVEAVAPPDYAADLEAANQRIAEYERLQHEEAVRQQRIEAQLAQAARDREEQWAREKAEELGEWNPEFKDAFLQGRSFLAQERDNAMQQAGMTASALDAFALAMEYESPEKAQAIVERAKFLMQYGDTEQRIAALQQEKMAHGSVNHQLAEKDRTIAELQLRLEAQGRNPAADAVDGGAGGSGAGWVDRWNAAKDLDAGFEAFRESLPAGW